MPEQQQRTSKRGEKVEVNWPRALGHFGNLGLVTAFEVIEPPLALFIGALPFIRPVEQSPVPRPLEETAGVLLGAGQATGTSVVATSLIRSSAGAIRKQSMRHTALR